MKTAKIIHIIGNSGKSTVSIALAQTLTNTLIVSLDLSNSTVAQFLPSIEQNASSLAEILADGRISQESFKGKIHARSKNVAILGTVTKDTPTSYNLNFSIPKLEQFMSTIKTLGFDYIIFDTKSDLSTDPLGLYLIDKSEATIRVLSPDIKGLEWLATQKRWLNRIDFNKHISVICPVHTFTPVSELKNQIGRIDIEFPFSLEVHNKFSAADDFSMTSTDGQLYCKQILRLKERIMNELHQ